VQPDFGPYLRLKRHNKIPYHETGEIKIDPVLPFTRFYMNEKLAPEAERAYQAIDDELPAYLVIRVLDGYGVLEDVLIDGTPLAEYAKSAIASEE
jgi:hypothetical protein